LLCDRKTNYELQSFIQHKFEIDSLSIIRNDKILFHCLSIWVKVISNEYQQFCLTL